MKKGERFFYNSAGNNAKKHFSLIVAVALAFSACSHRDRNDCNSHTNTKELDMYSNGVQDSFVISIELPEKYDKGSLKNYPGVYMPDVNFHFPILASVVRQYEKAGILPHLYLLGLAISILN